MYIIHFTCISDLILATCCIARASYIHASHIVHASHFVFQPSLIHPDLLVFFGQKGGRLVRTDLSPKSIAKEILRKLKKSPINLLCLEATPVEQIEEMEQQQEGNWTLEEIKGALMDDIKAMMQDELRQALAGLMPPPTAAPAPAAVTPVAANPPIMDAPPANNDNAGGQPLNAARNVPAIEMKFKDVENYIVKKAKKESLELVQDLESK